MLPAGSALNIIMNRDAQLIKRSAAYEAQRARGAVFSHYSGWELAESFGDLASEHAAVRRAAGLIDFSFRGKLEASGRHRVRFLHNMLSNDIQGLAPGSGCYAALLDAKGHLIADIVVHSLPETILLELDPQVKGKARELLARYIIADRVDFRDVSDDYAILSLQGPRAGEILARLLDEPPPSSGPYQHFEREVSGIKARIVAIDRTGSGGFDLWAGAQDAPRLWDILLDAGSPLGLQPVGMAAYEVLRVEAALPIIGIDMDESNLPLEAGLDRAISYTKGCYLGQEVVARLHYRGHVNKKLVGIEIDSQEVPRRGDKLFKDGREVGWITSAVRSLSLGRPIALAYVRREAMAEGTEVAVRGEAFEAKARVARTPFV